MKEKHKNGCNILIMTFTNLEKYVYSKKCLKQRHQHPHPRSFLSRRDHKWENTEVEMRALLRFQNTVSCCYLSSGVSYNTPNIYF